MPNKYYSKNIDEPRKAQPMPPAPGTKGHTVPDPKSPQYPDMPIKKGL